MRNVGDGDRRQRREQRSRAEAEAEYEKTDGYLTLSPTSNTGSLMAAHLGMPVFKRSSPFCIQVAQTCVQASN